MNYYATLGEFGPLVTAGNCSGLVVEGETPVGWFIRVGAPPSRYTDKVSEYDVWDASQMRWVANPDEANLRAADEVKSAEAASRAKAAAVTARRSALLQQSDWTQLPDVPLATKNAWAAYRQALRDITDQPGYPINITWPTPPN